MPLSINTNIASLTAQRAMLNTGRELETAFERLSTGKRVNTAVDDAAGLAIAERLTGRINGLNQAIRNVNDGISMVQIAEGTLDEVTTILQRMRDLSVQAANGSLSADERGYLDTEASKLAATLGKVVDQSEMNGTDLNDDATQTSVTIQAGSDAGDTISINFKALTEDLLGVSNATIDLAGTLQQKESITFDPAVANDAATKTKVYTLTVDGVVYSGNGGVAETVANVGALDEHLALATADDGSKLSDLYDVTGDGTTITLTAKVNGNLTATDYTLAHGAASAGANTGFSAGSPVIVDGKSTAEDAIKAVDVALATIAKERAVLGATNHNLSRLFVTLRTLLRTRLQKQVGSWIPIMLRRLRI